MATMIIRGAMACVLVVAAANEASATTVVIPSNKANSAGGNNVNSPFGAAGSSSYTFQIDYAASLLTAVPIGSLITAISFRLFPRNGTITQQLDYTNFDVQVGTSTAASPSQLTSNIANNQGADTILARSGALSFAANTLIGNKSVNPFFTIGFTTPYTYTGGDLLFTIRDVAAAGTAGVIVPLDAYNNSNSTVNTVSRNDSTATTGSVYAAYAPIMQLTYSAAAATVPEPESWAMMICGFGMIGGAVRRGRAMDKRRAQLA